MATIEALRDRLLELNENAISIRAQAESEKRDLTEEESRDLDEIFEEFERTTKQVQQLERIEVNNARLTQSQGRLTDPDDVDDIDDPAPPQVRANGQQRQPTQRPPRNAAPNGGDDLRPRVYPTPKDHRTQGKGGWHSFGDFAKGVMMACRGGGFVDPRLDIRNQPANYGSEGTGADGGYAVPPDFRSEIMQVILAEQNLLGRTDQQTSMSSSTTWPVDETAPWASTGGIQVQQTAEAGQKPTSKPALVQVNVPLHKTTALVPVTDELLEDAPALDGYLRRKVPEKFAFHLNNLVVNGSGVGEMQGIMNSGALIVIAKEAAQVADTVVWENIIKMWARMYAPSRPNAVWLINQDIEPQLFTMRFLIKNVAGTENVGGVPVYMPANGAAGAPFGTLMGRPILPTQAMQTLGDEGDIALVDLSQFLTVQKAGGIRQDVSIHLWFDYDITAFRFVLRIGGRTWLTNPISPRNGTNTLSPFVTLAARA